MDFQAPPAQPSFIPKRSQFTNSPSGSPVGIFMFIGVIVFLISAIGYGAVLVLASSVESDIQKANADLEVAQKNFGQFGVDQLTEIGRLDLKLKTAQQLINNHVSLLRIYADLEGLTYQTVRFKSFKYGLSEDGKITLKMSGEAKSYTDLNNYVPVALQSKKFVGIPNVKDVIFSDLNLDQSGNVVFNFNATLDPKVVSYRENRLLQ